MLARFLWEHPFAAVFQKKTEIEEFRALHEMFSGKLTDIFLHVGFPLHLSRVKVVSPHLSYLIRLLSSVSMEKVPPSDVVSVPHTPRVGQFLLYGWLWLHNTHFDASPGSAQQVKSSKLAWPG